jgi:hypothetical protein
MRMKHLKSSYSDLRIIFEQSITVKHLAEPLASFDEKRRASDVREVLEEKDYDAIGVRKSGIITGYACREHLNGGIIRDYTKNFNQNNVLEEREPLSRIMYWRKGSRSSSCYLLSVNRKGVLFPYLVQLER